MGGSYTPPALVRFCLDRVAALAPDGELRVLEPSAGDGAFIRGIAESGLRPRVVRIVAIEPVEREAAKLRQALADARLGGDVLTRSAIAWAAAATESFDLAVGNPPFVRFQFLTAADRASLPDLAEAARVRPLSGVGNLWIPVLLGALSRLREGGAAAFVIPTECLTGVSAGAVRAWLTSNMDRLRLDLFPPGSFPHVLQEVLVLSGVRRGTAVASGELRIVDHDGPGEPRAWTHAAGGSGGWTRYLLTPSQLDALRAASALPFVTSLGSVATFEVSIVTGANAYFSATPATLAAYDLATWAKPLLPRVRHAAGLRYTGADHAALRAAGTPCWLLRFGPDAPSPLDRARPRRYVEEGERAGLHERYKCRIREPWFRVPGVRAGSLLLSKRAHRQHRLIRNEAGVLTTDTIYRGSLRPGSEHLEGSLVAGFHNSLTLLTAELEGRSFGGGVLELVPSEIARLAVPASPAQTRFLDELDALARSARGGDALVEATDRLLSSARIGFPADLAALLAEARHALLARRLSRGATRVGGDADVGLAA